MLARLSKGEANVSDLARPFLKEMSLPAATKHLQVLEKARLITKTRQRIIPSVPTKIAPEDLEQEGMMALIKAVDQFDPSRNVKFESYAISMVRGAMLEYLRKEDWVPRSVRARARDVEKAHAQLEAQLQRAPTDEEMAGKLKTTVEEFQDSLLEIANSSVLALDDLWTFADPEGGGGQISVLDTIHDPSAVDPETEAQTSELKDRLADAIESLPERERLVVALYYYENLTLREIGEVLGVTESRVSQLHTKAVLALRSRFRPPE